MLFLSINRVSAWHILLDDGRPKVARYNNTLCILAGNFENSTVIAQGNNGGMVMVNSQGVSNKAIATRVIMLCRGRFCNNITFSSYIYRNYEDYYTWTAILLTYLTILI